MDKIEIRAYTFDDLVGSCGGYIGLFLGYALIQIPRGIRVRFNAMKEKSLTDQSNEMNISVNREDV